MRLAILAPIGCGLVLMACGPEARTTPINNVEQPLNVVVDTGQTMTANGGQGIGVFIEYRAGGHWHVWWACDTTLSGASCNFTVKMGVADGSIQNAASTQFGANDTLQNAPDQLVATTTTTTQTSMVDFDATAGAKMTVDVVMSGLRDPSFFFFVQNGVINGGYQGTLTDPLIFEPSTP